MRVSFFIEVDFVEIEFHFGYSSHDGYCDRRLAYYP